MNNHDIANEHEDLQQLFQRTGPRNVPVDVDSILGRESTELSETHSRLPKLGIPFAAVLVLAASLMLLLFIPDRSPESLAFAQVKEQVEHVRTVDYIQTSLVVDVPPKGAIDTRFGEQTPTAALKALVESLEAKLPAADAGEKAEIAYRLALLKPCLDPDATGIPEGIQRIRIKGKQLQRTDDIFPFGQFYTIRNAQTGQTASFDRERKTKSLLTTQVAINRKTGETKETPIETPATVDFFHRFRLIPENATERLPGKELDGVDVIGFRSVEEHETGTWTRTFWIDEMTKLPVQIVTDFVSKQQGLGSSKWIQDHFVFDGELDDSLFDTKTPAGYTEKEEKVYGYQ